MPQRPDESDDAFERRVRIENMETDTAKKLHEINLSTKQFELELRKMWWQATATAGGLLAAGGAVVAAMAGLARLIWFHQ